ncbi:unnamed protein product [Rotaria sp. Silwood1]|nr:unnamed protein product [Rotaria sp. Silwood1]
MSVRIRPFGITGIGGTHLYSTPYHPMTNGQIERFNTTMDAKIAALSNEKRTNWDEQLPFVTFNYNTSIHKTTGQIPFELIYGRSPTLSFDQQQPLVTLSQDPEYKSKLSHYLATLTGQAKVKILSQQTKYKERYDRYRMNPTYKVGDIVLIKTFNKLISQAKLTNHFSIDTEDDALSHKPAAFQVEFIRPNAPSIVIIIEVQYLPLITNPLFKKIQQLCTIIFTSNNHVYSWGLALQELGKLNSFNLFSKNIQIKEHDIQDEYSGAQKAGLQKTIKHEFNEYLNKTATLVEWACGVDLALRDIFTIRFTRLSFKLDIIKFSSTNDYEDVSEDEDNINLQQELSIDIPSTYEELIVHVIDELEETNEDTLSHQQHEEIEPTQQMSIFNQTRNFNTILEIHENFPDNETHESFNVEQDVIELQLNDDMDIQSLPEIMKVHFYHEPSRPHLQQHHNEQSSIQQMTVHVTNEQHQVSNSHHLGPNPTTTTFTSKQLRNRKTNRRHRINRYRYEVIRQVYRLFSITKIKRILRSMNIFYVNINMVRHKLFIGLKNQTMVDEVEKILHNRIFTKQHYHRLYR